MLGRVARSPGLCAVLCGAYKTHPFEQVCISPLLLGL